MKRMLMISTLMFTAANTFAADVRDFNKAKYGREFVTLAQEKEYLQKAPKQSESCQHTCCNKCC